MEVHVQELKSAIATWVSYHVTILKQLNLIQVAFGLRNSNRWNYRIAFTRIDGRHCLKLLGLWGFRVKKCSTEIVSHPMLNRDNGLRNYTQQVKDSGRIPAHGLFSCVYTMKLFQLWINTSCIDYNPSVGRAKWALSLILRGVIRLKWEQSGLVYGCSNSVAMYRSIEACER